MKLMRSKLDDNESANHKPGSDRDPDRPFAILVVEDDEATLEALTEALKDDDHEIAAVTDAAQAIQAFRTRVFRLVVVDWGLPEMSGLELCRALRRESSIGYTYIILMTARKDKSLVLEGLRAGADDFLTKPVDFAELAMRVQAGKRILQTESRDLALFFVAKLVESRDPETGRHVERVQHYSRAIAMELFRTGAFAEIDASFVQLIHHTSPLHDIGKVAIPDSILRKPGRLTPDEFELIKTHTTQGAASLDLALQHHPQAHYLKMARDIAASHHEKFNGTGYPLGLRGDEIPLCARIVAVADCYDAIVSKRTYKPAIPHSEVMRMLSEGAGLHFDPRVLDAFIRIEDQILEIRDRFQDEPV